MLYLLYRWEAPPIALTMRVAGGGAQRSSFYGLLLIEHMFRPILTGSLRAPANPSCAGELGVGCTSPVPNSSSPLIRGGCTARVTRPRVMRQAMRWFSGSAFIALLVVRVVTAVVVAIAASGKPRCPKYCCMGSASVWQLKGVRVVCRFPCCCTAACQHASEHERNFNDK